MNSIKVDKFIYDTYSILYNINHYNTIKDFTLLKVRHHQMLHRSMTMWMLEETKIKKLGI